MSSSQSLLSFHPDTGNGACDGDGGDGGTVSSGKLYRLRVPVTVVPLATVLRSLAVWMSCLVIVWVLRRRCASKATVCWYAMLSRVGAGEACQDPVVRETTSGELVLSLAASES